ncbi:hypothetical protein V6N13_048841 [Hibiscus sabdariffa]
MYGNRLVDGIAAGQHCSSRTWAGNGDIVEDIMDLVSRPWNVNVFHVDRRKNTVADKLAAMSRDKAIGESILDRPPGEVLDLLKQDSFRI